MKKELERKTLAYNFFQKKIIRANYKILSLLFCCFFYQVQATSIWHKSEAKLTYHTPKIIAEKNSFSQTIFLDFQTVLKDHLSDFREVKNDMETIVAPVTISVQITDDDDDAEEQGSFFSINSSDLELGEDGGMNQIIGLRFSGLNIPSGSSIINAYIEFVADGTHTDALSLDIYAEDTGNAVNFATNGDIDGRTWTATPVDWDNVENWNTSGDSYNSPDISTLVQTIIDRGDWASGNAMMMIIDLVSASGTRRAESANGVANSAPTLHVTYDPTGGSNLSCAGASNEITGSVFEDFNYNGVYDIGEYLGLEGVSVNLSDAFGNTFTATTGTDGSYSINGLVAGRTYRVHFTNLPTWANPTFNGGDNGTTVQFVEAGNCANLGVANSSDYCGSDNPELATPCYIEGDPTAGGTSGTRDWLVSFDYNNAGEIGDTNYPEPNIKLDGQTIGSTWGIAYQRQSQSLFAAATIKRHSGLGTGGTDAIYRIDLSGASPSVSTFLNLTTYVGVNTGTNPRDGTPNNTLDANTNSNSRDINAFSAVGKTAFGDLEISEDGQTLYAINLNDRALHTIQIGDTPTAPATINTYPIASEMVSLYPSGCGSAADYRPWALKFHKGLLYVGVVCSAETSQITSQLHAYVISFDPANPSNGFSAVFDFDLNYTREVILDYQGNQIAGEWRPWLTSWNQVTVVGSDNNAGAPQPIFTSIEFDTDGSMIFGLMDRFGSQSGFYSYSSNIGDDNLYIGIAGGDVVRACKSGNSFVIEGNAGCSYKNGFEYYDQDFFHAADVFGSPLEHNELSFGSLILLAGKGEVASTMYDPFWIQSGGIGYWNNQTASTSHEYELYNFDQTSDSGPFGKANGLGDLELLCDPAPIQIGNYVWEDDNGDGIQDAGEQGIDGVIVELVKDGTVIATTQTANGGQYYFSDENANDANLTWTGTGQDVALLPNTTYSIRISDAEGASQQTGLNNLLLTPSDANSNNSDELDSDASLNGTVAETSLTTGAIGETNQTIDFGFTPPCNIELSTSFNNCIDDGNGTFRTIYDAEISWDGAPATEIIQVYVNGTLFTTVDPNSSTSPHAFNFEVTADGTGRDSLWAYFGTTTSCGDTVSFKSPTPCPVNLGDEPGQACTNAAGFISGTVWEDWNYNGAMDENVIIGVQGIQVILTDDCGNSVATTYTDSSGNYEFSGLNNGTTYRVAFVLPESVACWAKPTQAGTDNGTTIQFVQAGNCSNLGVASPADYCTDDIQVFTPCYVVGDDAYNANAAIVQVDESGGASGTNASEYDSPPYNNLLNAGEIGAVWGLAYSKSEGELYMGSYIKRHTDLGTSNNPTTIYKYNVDTDTYIDWFTLDGTASNPHSGPSDGWASDFDAFDKVFKSGWGDVDINEVENTIYGIDLDNRALVEIPILNNGAAGTANSISIVPAVSAAMQANGCTSENDIRPFGLGVNKGKVYVGVVCSGESSINHSTLPVEEDMPRPGNTSLLWAYVFEWDGSTGFSKVLEFSLDYERGCAQGSQNGSSCKDDRNANWSPWVAQYPYYDINGSSHNGFAFPQAAITDIEFDNNDDMIIGLGDRWGSQVGAQTNTPAYPQNSGGGTGFIQEPTAVGDILRACHNGNDWTIEELLDNTNTACGTSGQASYLNGTIQVDEYYFEDDYGIVTQRHNETALGGLLQIPGALDVMTTAVDPVRGRDLQFYDGGINWYNNSDGSWVKSYRVFNGSSSFDGLAGKTTGLGDLAAYCAPAPIEIGNYVWEDEDGDGIQDACESPIAGVNVSLYKNGTKIAETQTSATGQYYFSDKNATDPNLIWSGTNADTMLLPNMEYQIVFGESQYANNELTIGGEMYRLTTQNVESNDRIDSDAMEMDVNGTTFPAITATTGNYGCMDHSFDVGFLLGCPPEICLPIKVTVKKKKGTN